MIDIRQLKYFIAVAETGHVGRAADILNISQPPLSRQIMLLEQTLGAELFVRHARGVTLTAAGEQFLVDATAVVAALNQACKNVGLIANGQQGKLSIGFMMHAAYSVVPSLTRLFIETYPQVALKLQEVIPGELKTHVLNGKFDAAIMLNPGESKGLNTLDMKQEFLCLALPADHSLVNESSINARQLKQETFIAAPFHVAPLLRHTIESYCKTAGFTPRIVLETELQQTIVSLVAEGLGVALVPEPVKKLQMSGVVYRSLINPPQVDYVIAWREDNRNPALHNFLNIAQQYLQ